MQDKELQIKAEQLKILFAPAFPVTIAHLTAAILMVSLFWEQTRVSHDELIVFAVSISVLAILRLVLFFTYKRKPLSPSQVDTWVKLFLIGSIILGLVWALTEVWIFPRLDESHQLKMVLMIGGIAALSTITLSAMRSIYITFLPMLATNRPVRF